MIDQLRPTNWNDLPNISDLDSLNETDEHCLKEIKTVLERHNRTRKFGITLLHSHFAINEDEVFLEHTDVATRTLVSRPISTLELANKSYRPTVWRFDGEKPQGCSYCPTDEDHNHLGYKEPC